LKDEMKIFNGIFGIISHEGNIFVEMCRDEFFLKYALQRGTTF